MLLIITLIVCLCGDTAHSTATYVDNQKCLACHQEAAKQWKSSDHYYSMQLANKNSVLGNFKHARYQDKYREVTFDNKEGKYTITERIKPEKNTHTYTVKYTFGHRPLQQYLLEFPQGKFQAFDVAWDTLKHRWINLDDEHSRQPSSARHWTKRAYTWNYACADCHSTAYKKNYRKEQYHSRFSGINVNCQACHGPGSDHLRWQQDKHLANKGLVNRLTTVKARDLLNICAPCHSRRAQISDSQDPTQRFEGSYIPSLLRSDLYHADGQIKEEVFVYGSFIQSKMYRAGVSCIDCHDPHSLSLKRSGNNTCTLCHNDSSKKAFKGLKTKNYQAFNHSHHKPGTSGSFCVDCHMPATTYMKVDPRRDHSFKIPSPKLTIQYGIPNACNRCHRNKSAEWAEKTLEQWHGKTKQTTLLLKTDDAHLLNIIRDKSSPPIFIASALMLLSLEDKAHLAAIASHLSSAEVMVRLAAVRQLAKLPLAIRRQYLRPMLNDNNIIIRATAASALANNNPEPDPQLKKALEDFLSLQKANLDSPEAHVNLAQLAIKLGRKKYVIAALRQAISVDKHFIPAYLLLSEYYQAIGDRKKSLDTIQLGLRHNPENTILRHLLSNQKNH